MKTARWLWLLVAGTAAVATAVGTRGPAAFAAGGGKVDHGGLTRDLDCSACHSPEGWGLSGSADGSGFDHDRTGFSLRGAHVSTTCTGCHDGRDALPTECEGCHRDEHQRRMEGPCAECHQATDWHDTEALADHRMTRMPLTGKHALLDCTACHVRRADRTFSDAPTDCYACHARDYHADNHPDHDGDESDAALQPLARECGRCHRVTGWTPAVVDPATFERRLGVSVEHDAHFELSTGPHRDAACASCHVGARRTARVRCDGCHAREQLTQQHGRRTESRAPACLRCHPRGAAR